MHHIRTLILLLLVLVVSCVLLIPGAREEPFESKNDRIFVSVASYRDAQCNATIKQLFDKAADPSRVFVGICEQNTDDAKEECVTIDTKHRANIRRISIPHTEAKGPCYARYLCSTLYRGEEYFMQLDSHMTLVPDWDTKVLNIQKSCPDPAKAVLSHYPHDAATYTVDEKSVPVLCDAKWNEDHVPQLNAIIQGPDFFKNGPRPIPFLSGGFVFGPGSLLRDVPYDPNLDHLFQGEEILYSIRAWTAGYNFYTPTHNIVLHAYYRKGEPKFHEDIKGWAVAQKKSAKRARQLLGLDTPVIAPGEDPYGLGTARTVAAYWAFSGMDPTAKTATSKDKFCS